MARGAVEWREDEVMDSTLIRPQSFTKTKPLRKMDYISIQVRSADQALR